MPKLTDKQLWDALEDAAIDAEIESELAMTPEERRAEMIAAGFNMDEMNAKADALFASLKPPAPIVAEAPVASRAPVPVSKRTVFRLEILAPTALALAAGVALVIHSMTPDIVSSPHPETPASRAAALREQAKADCDAQRWRSCLEEIDKARTLDPAGEDKAEVVALRKLAEEHR